MIISYAVLREEDEEDVQAFQTEADEEEATLRRSRRQLKDAIVEEDEAEAELDEATLGTCFPVFLS